MKCKPLSVFQIYGYKMCVKLGLCLCLCFLAVGEMFRGRANADASLVPAQRGLSCPRVCSLALLLTAHLLCPYLMMLNHGVDFKTWFWLILLGKHPRWWLPVVPFPLLLHRGDQSSGHEVVLDAAGLPKLGRLRLPHSELCSLYCWQMMLAGSLDWLQYYG